MLKATLIKNVIVAGADIDDPDRKIGNERVEKMYSQIRDRLRFLARRDGIDGYFHRHCFKKGTMVEVIEVRDSMSNQQHFKTPNIPGVVADIRGANWDGEIVESCVRIEDLDLGVHFAPEEKTTPEAILRAFQDYQIRKNTQ